jgi:integrase
LRGGLNVGSLLGGTGGSNPSPSGEESANFRSLNGGRIGVARTRQDAWRIIVRRARKAGLLTRLGSHSFRATGITVYLLNGGLLEYAQQMAAHESARTTKLYDRRNDQITLDQVERIVL